MVRDDFIHLVLVKNVMAATDAQVQNLIGPRTSAQGSGDSPRNADGRVLMISAFPHNAARRKIAGCDHVDAHGGADECMEPPPWRGDSGRSPKNNHAVGIAATRWARISPVPAAR